MEILKKYPFNNTDKENIIFIKLVSEFYNSLNQKAELIKEPHCLTLKLENIYFYEEETKENIERHIESILDCYEFFKSTKSLLENFSEKDYIDFFSFKGLFNQMVEEEQYKEIAFFIIKILNENNITKKEIVDTPQIISDICNQILQVKENETCLDFAFGKGGLALEVGKKKIFGVEINERTQQIDNLLLKIANKDGYVTLGNSLDIPIENADVVVTNPPFSENIRIPKENADYLQWGNLSKMADLYYLSLALSKAKSRGAVIVAPGVLFRGGTEGEVRNNIIKEGFIEGVILLPATIMYSTSIPVCIVFFRKDKPSDKIFMFDASGEEFFKKIRGGVNISPEKLKRIVEIYNNFEEIENISRFVSVDEVLLNEGSLIVIKYITPKKEKKDIKVLFEDVKKNMIEAKFYGEKSNEILKKLLGD